LLNHGAHHILIKPLLSEKAYQLSTQWVYVFKVHQQANKNDVKKAFEMMYQKTPVSVNIAVLPSKYRFNRLVKSSFKKAIITLSKGDTIDLM